MEKMILIINWIVFGCLFFAFFIKTTDQKERSICRKSAYIILTFFSLFMSVSFFKHAFIYNDEKNVLDINAIETIFNVLILFLMITKVKEDKIFNKLKKKK
jgi:hypothetical protein